MHIKSSYYVNFIGGSTTDYDYYDYYDDYDDFDEDPVEEDEIETNEKPTPDSETPPEKPKPKPKPKPKKEEPDEENVLVDFASLTAAELEKSFGTYKPVNSINPYMVKADPCKTISLTVNVTKTIDNDSSEFKEKCKGIEDGTECVQ